MPFTFLPVCHRVSTSRTVGCEIDGGAIETDPKDDICVCLHHVCISLRCGFCDVVIAHMTANASLHTAVFLIPDDENSFRRQVQFFSRAEAHS
jgi:hypothetical protein